jgi:hypothetical protein
LTLAPALRAAFVTLVLVVGLRRLDFLRDDDLLADLAAVRLVPLFEPRFVPRFVALLVPRVLRFVAAFRVPRFAVPFLLPVLRADDLVVDLRVDVRVDLRAAFLAPVFRADLRAADLRLVPEAPDLDPRFVPVLEPAVPLELFLDDFLVATLCSGTVLVEPT